MQIETKKVKLSEIKINPDNPRTITGKAMDNLVKSLQDFPDMMKLREIVIDENMMIIGGCMRFRALQQIGKKDCLAKIVKGLIPEQKREFIIKDNSAFGAWDMDALANDWSDLPLAEWGLELSPDWFTPDPPEPQDAEPQIDKAEELNKIWKVKTGNFWQIGDHRLLCGDSTKAEDVARVMDGEKADMVFTDPPYGISLDTDFSSMKNELKFAQAKGVKAGKKYNQVEGDHEDFKPELISSLFDNFNYCKEMFLFGADYYSEHLTDKNGGSWIVWDKRSNDDTPDDIIASRDRIFTSAFELCWSKYKHKRKIARILWAGIFGTEKENNHVRYHPTQKPVRLIEWFLNNWGNTGDILADPFLGSGTTMVACQNLNRKCRGIEISENYCAVTLQRMTDAFPDIEIKSLKRR